MSVPPFVVPCSHHVLWIPPVTGPGAGEADPRRTAYVQLVATLKRQVPVCGSGESYGWSGAGDGMAMLPVASKPCANVPAAVPGLWLQEAEISEIIEAYQQQGDVEKGRKIGIILQRTT